MFSLSILLILLVPAALIFVVGLKVTRARSTRILIWLLATPFLLVALLLVSVLPPWDELFKLKNDLRVQVDGHDVMLRQTYNDGEFGYYTFAYIDGSRPILLEYDGSKRWRFRIVERNGVFYFPSLGESLSECPRIEDGVLAYPSYDLGGDDHITIDLQTQTQTTRSRR